MLAISLISRTMNVLYTVSFRLFAVRNDFVWIYSDLKIEKLCKVMGIPDNEIYDPDNTYELTTDNVKKILAIQMRFRCVFI